MFDGLDQSHRRVDGDDDDDLDISRKRMREMTKIGFLDEQLWEIQDHGMTDRNTNTLIFQFNKKVEEAKALEAAVQEESEKGCAMFQVTVYYRTFLEVVSGLKPVGWVTKEETERNKLRVVHAIFGAHGFDYTCPHTRMGVQTAVKTCLMAGEFSVVEFLLQETQCLFDRVGRSMCFAFHLLRTVNLPMFRFLLERVPVTVGISSSFKHTASSRGFGQLEDTDGETWYNWLVKNTRIIERTGDDDDFRHVSLSLCFHIPRGPAQTFEKTNAELREMLRMTKAVPPAKAVHAMWRRRTDAMFPFFLKSFILAMAFGVPRRALLL